MSFSPIPAQTNALSLETFIALLARRAVVDGILLMGSTGSGTVTASSDYDLLLVLADESSPLRMVVTWVDGHLTELYCTSTAALTRIVSRPEDWLDGTPEGATINWLRAGRIAHDRNGLLAAAQEIARAAPPPALDTANEAYWAWGKIGYNVAQAKRYLASDDPIYQEVVDFRLLYSLAEVMTAYFAVRALPWRGEKEAILYWTTHDPAYLARFRECLAERDRQRKVALYEELGHLTLAPVGGLWTVGTTAVGAGVVWGAGADTAHGSIDETIAYGQALVSP